MGNNEGLNLHWVHAAGGNINELPVKGTTAGGQFRSPSPLGENHILASSWPSGIYAYSLDDGTSIQLTDRGRNPRYLASGHLAFAYYGRMMVAPFSIDNLEITGEVISVIEDLRTEEHSAQAAISSNGDLIYVPGISSSESELVLRSYDGIENKLQLVPDYYGQVEISSDGSKLVFLKQDTRDLYVHELQNLTTTRLTNSGISSYGIWGPGTSEITYGTGNQIYKMDASGINEPVRVLSTDYAPFPRDWFSDGSILMYDDVDSTNDVDIKFHFLDEEKEDLILMPNRGGQALSSFSPNDKYVAYTSGESGQSEIYVQPFPPTGERWTVSSNGGEEPLWSPDGEKLFYRNKQDWYEASISTKPEFSVIGRRKLFTGPYLNLPGYSYDITPDGQHFLLAKPVDTVQTSTRLKVVKNWFEEIKRLAPTE